MNLKKAIGLAAKERKEHEENAVREIGHVQDIHHQVEPNQEKFRSYLLFFVIFAFFCG